MEIIRQGNTYKTKKQFVCTRCGCIWNAEKGEYNVTSQLGVMHDGMKAYNMKCPCCGNIVDTD